MAIPIFTIIIICFFAVFIVVIIYPIDPENPNWTKSTLTFAIDNQINSDKHELSVVIALTSTERISNDFKGWQGVFDYINEVVPDNNVPDKVVQIFDKQNADILIVLTPKKETVDEFGKLTVGGAKLVFIPDSNIITRAKILFPIFYHPL